MTRRLVLTLPLLALALAGCAEPGTTTQAGSGGSGSSPAASAPPASPTAEPTVVETIPPAEQVDPGAIATPFPEQPGDVVAVPEAQVDATALPEGNPRQVWTDPTGTVLGFYGVGGGCTVVESALVSEDATTVQVSLRQAQPTDGRACTEELAYPVQSVPLAAPLGTRPVVISFSAA